MMNKTDYCKRKAEIIRLAESGKNVSDAIRELSLRATEYSKSDADIEWLRVYAKTKNFTKALLIKKAEKLIAPAMNMNPIGTSAFSECCEQKAGEYFETCRKKTKKEKRIKIGVAIACCLLLVCAAVGVWYGDKTGVFYGQESVSFIANGQAYRQDNAVRYNDYVQLAIPAKKGYDATGIIDTKTQKRLFDASGKSLSVVTSRDLSDYDNCSLEVTYEPHVYSAQVMSAKNVSLSSVTYTVEDKPDEILDEPQHLEGYVFDGWYTDAKFKKPFTGDFMDYADDNQPLVLYPHYSLDGWTLTWQLNGGAFKSDVVDTYTILSDVRLPDGEIVVREGYELKGWSMDGRLIDYFTPTVMKDAVISAVWEPISYKLTYELNGGSLDEKITSFTVEDEFLIESPIKPGYIFDGWFANKIFTKTVAAIEQGTIGDKTVFAKWSPIVYTISYTLNGGENSPLNPMTYTADKNVLLQKPQRTGYTFIGWVSGNNKITELNAVENGNVELNALWEANEYTITINPNNGQDVYSKTVRYDEAYSIELPLRKGYEFDGYTVDGALMNLQGIYRYTCNITAIANYTPIVYTITYELNGGEGCTLNPSSYTAEKNVRLQNPTRTGYTFKGWFIGGDERVEELNAAVNGSVDLTALWKANEYVVTVNPNNGGEVYKQIVCYDAYYSIAQPDRKGYTFTGFSMAGEPIDSVGQYTFTTDISVIANYRANQYTISYVSDAHTVSLQQVIYDEPYALYSPKTKLNHEFVGWFDKEVGGNRVSDGVYRIDGNTVLYASWIQVITFKLENNTNYTIDSAIDKAYIVGNYNGKDNFMTGVNIKIASRCYDLKIELINTGFKASNDNSAICAESDGFLLTVDAVGTCYICGGDGSASTDPSKKSNDGKAAIEASRLVLTSERASSFKLQGGNGANGCKGTDGAKESTGLVWCNWGHSGGTGGTGGDSGAAIRVITYTDYSKVELLKGSAGAGGIGGSAGYRKGWFAKTWGSDGSKGTDGTVVATIRYESEWA